MDCLFCKIAAGEIPARLVYEDEAMVAFADLHPQAPVHLLLIPRRHIETLNDLTAADDALIGALLRRAALLARAQGLADRGYRTVINTHADAGQTVFHLHVHLLGGRSLGWPPG
jgi:histidine triad (HIT) family protein